PGAHGIMRDLFVPTLLRDPAQGLSTRGCTGPDAGLFRKAVVEKPDRFGGPGAGAISDLLDAFYECPQFVYPVLPPASGTSKRIFRATPCVRHVMGSRDP